MHKDQSYSKGRHNKHDNSNNQKIFFVHPEAVKWNGIIESNDLDSSLTHIRGGRDAWIITTYLLLKNHTSLPVALTDDFVVDAICICHFDDIPRSNYPWRSYIVVVRADRDRPFLCDTEIVQSPAAIEHQRCYYIPHWPQPGLRPRSTERGNQVENIGYFGELKNLSAAFRCQKFEQSLRDIGVNLVLRDIPESWSDYADIDVLLAIRDGSDYFLAAKPATKLFNAWLAGVPIIVGQEPAYNYHRESKLDYILAASPDEVITAVDRLRHDPELYQAMIQNGLTRSHEVNRDATSAKWEGLILETLYPHFKKSISRPLIIRAMLHIIRHPFRKLRIALRGSMYVRGVDFQGTIVSKNLNPARQFARFVEKNISKIFD